MEEDKITSNYKAAEGQGKDVVTGNYSEQEDTKLPSFYAVIPATVRYDRSLPWGALILYGEISAMTHKTGYCWASNAYFMNLYGTKERTISNWISALRNAGHIIVYYEYFPNSKKIKQRRIRLPLAIVKAVKKNIDTASIPANDPASDANFCTTKPAGGDKNVTTNLAYFCTTNPTGSVDNDENITIDPISGVYLPTTRPTGTDKNVTTNPVSTANFCTTNPAVVQKNAPPGGAKKCGDNITNSYKAAAAASSKKPPPDPLFKAAFSSVDPTLVFDPAFYPRAAAFLAENALPAGNYIPWVYKQCLAKKPDSTLGMFVKLFFAPDMAERFKISFKPPSEPVFVSCPACGARHDQKQCPQCGLDSRAPPEEIAFHKRLWSLPPERRTEYERRARQLLFGVSLQDYDPEQSRSRFDDLKREFDLPVAL